MGIYFSSNLRFFSSPPGRFALVQIGGSIPIETNSLTVSAINKFMAKELQKVEVGPTFCGQLSTSITASP